MALPFGAVDLELRRDLCLELDHAAGSTTTSLPALVYSAHLPEGTSTGELRRLLEEPLPRPGVRKLVLPASVSRAVFDLIPFVEGLPHPRPAVLTTGPSGPLFRLWAAQLQMPLVFGSLEGDPSLERVEAAQLPVRMLRSIREGPDLPVLYGLLGSPVDQSPSPSLFERWFASKRAHARYISLELSDPRVLRVVLEALSTHDFRGVNITHPLKLAASELPGTSEKEANESGCVNLLHLGPSGWRKGNTDVRAFDRRVTELETLRGAPFGSALVFGAGGAARASLACLGKVPRTLSVLARNPDQVAGLARYFGRQFDPAAHRPYDLVVNATPSGRAEVAELPAEWLNHILEKTVVLDWVYRPTSRHLASYCAGHGAQYEDGSRLLVYQAAESFREWFGETISPAEERAGLEIVCAV
jgi:shikimate 5-dehydrogenase